MNKKVLIGTLLLVLVIGGISILKTAGILPSFSEVKEGREMILGYVESYYLLSVIGFALIYILSVALSLPIAVFLTLLAGFLFGTVFGTMLVSLSSTIGATIIFLSTRFFFRDYVEAKFRDKISWLQKEMSGNGLRNILILRLIPAVPFWLINIGAGVTSVKTRDYVLGTLIGALPFTAVYVFAGTRLAEINSPSDVVSLPTLLAVSLLVLLSVVPLFIRRRQKEGQDDVSMTTHQ